MNRTLQILSAVALVIIAGTAAFLSHWKARHRLGAPGVRVSAEPLIDSAGQVARTNSIVLPAQVPGFLSTNQPVTVGELNYLPADTLYGRRSYFTPDGSFQAFASIVLMGTDRTSIHRPEACLPGQGLVIERSFYTNIVVPKPHRYRLPVRRFDTITHLEEEGRALTVKGVFVFWFVADGRLTADHLERMWSMGQELLTQGTLQRWAYVAYFARCAPGDEEITYHRLTELIAASVPEFQTATGSAID